jgi:tetratricopeptide (TPR) repeat protein
LKVQRQRIAGLDASGIGGDLGLIVRPTSALGMESDWARPLTLGLSVRNVVEPKLRFETESVGDPMTLRVGTAYRYHLARSSHLLAAFDLEKADGIAPRLHGGFELRLLPALTLRTGLDRGAATAGAGLQLRGLAVDYAFENNELGAIHRIGVKWNFGPTVEESRLAALEAEEEALRQQLADAFDQRQRDQTARLLAEAEAAHQEGRYDDALRTLAVLNTLVPDLENARQMEIDCWSAKGEQLERAGEFADAALAYRRVLSLSPEDPPTIEAIERCRSESDQRAERTAELRQRFSAALDAFSLGDLVPAREGFTTILAMEPNDLEAATMLERTEQAIARRANDLLEQADRLLRADLLGEASGLLKEARRLSPTLPGLTRAESMLAQKREAARAQQAATAGVPETAVEGDLALGTTGAEPGSVPELSVKERREVEELYKRGLRAMEQQRPDEAVRYWELVHSIDPSHGQVKDHLHREYLMGGMDSFANGRLDEAVALWEKALRLDPSDKKARGYLARAQQQIERTREILGHH